MKQTYEYWQRDTTETNVRGKGKLAKQYKNVIPFI